ncbi:MAG: hypothetical protein MUC49_21115 [Raineya sp.]|jgi:hypothetical protein|nr:hypothetical protein [Raineya sp.]
MTSSLNFLNLLASAKKFFKSFFVPLNQRPKISEEERTEMFKVLSHMHHLYIFPNFEEKINTLEMKSYCKSLIIEMISKFKCDERVKYICETLNISRVYQKSDLLKILKNLNPSDINYALVFRVPYVIIQENCWISNLKDFRDIESKFEPFFEAQIKQYVEYKEN